MISCHKDIIEDFLTFECQFFDCVFQLILHKQFISTKMFYLVCYIYLL